LERIIYIRLRHRIEVDRHAVLSIKDVASIVDTAGEGDRIGRICIHRVTDQDKNTIVLDGMRIISAIIRQIPSADCQLIGPQQTIVQVRYKKKKGSFPLFLLVWILLFLGSAFTIMNFHEDVSMRAVHQKLYYLLTGMKAEKPLWFQIPYSFGLGIGMILFFNHVFKKKINEEPSPLEVEMFNYQEAVDAFLIRHENKEGGKPFDEP
jgi:Stage V sporulation protein AA.